MSGDSMRAGQRGPGFGKVLVSLMVTAAAFILLGKQVEVYGLIISIKIADSLPIGFRPRDADAVVLGIKSGCAALAASLVFVLLLSLFRLAAGAGRSILCCQKCGKDLHGVVELTCPKCREAA